MQEFFFYFGPLLSVEKMHIFIGIVVLILFFFFIWTKLRRIIHAAELIYFVHELHIWPLGGWLFTDGNGRSGLSVCDNSSRNFSLLKYLEMQSNKDNRKDDLLNELASDYANYLVVDSDDEVRAIARILKTT